MKPRITNDQQEYHAKMQNWQINLCHKEEESFAMYRSSQNTRLGSGAVREAELYEMIIPDALTYCTLLSNW